MTSEQPLLEVDNLKVDFHTPTGIVRAVRGLSFTLGRERLGIVGESGSGKSMTGRAILDLIPHPGVVSADRMRFRGQDLTAMDKGTRRKLRGRHISMVMQDPKFSLNPVETVGSQIAEAYRIHRKAGVREARERSLAMLEQVQIREPARVYDLYPPEVLIADEPTSALDVTVQLQILKILDDLVTERGMGLIFISHDLHLVQSFCDRVIVMYGGKVMETLPAAELADPAARSRRHPYTLGLLECLPDLDHPRAKLATLNRDPAWLA